MKRIVALLLPLVLGCSRTDGWYLEAPHPLSGSWRQLREGAEWTRVEAGDVDAAIAMLTTALSVRVSKSIADDLSGASLSSGNGFFLARAIEIEPGFLDPRISPTGGTIDISTYDRKCFFGGGKMRRQPILIASTAEHLVVGISITCEGF